jgi:hypothetical protein
MPPQETSSSGIKWNEMTWYSRLGAIILFVGVVPALCFYIGMQYEITRLVLTPPIILQNISANVASRRVVNAQPYQVPTATSSSSTTTLPTDKSFNPNLATEVIHALKNQDGAALAMLVSPGRGVRFSSSAYVSDSDQVFTRDELRDFFTNKNIYTWGVTDGEGADIRLTPMEYYKKYIYDADYANAPQVSYNQVLGQGNTTNNAAEFYPDSMIVEYYFPGFDTQAAGMDWTSLRLVFQKEANTWYLSGIIKDNWTI